MPRDLDETLDPQDVVPPRTAARDARRQRVRDRRSSASSHDEAVEIVVIVLQLGVMPRAAIFDVVLDCAARARAAPTGSTLPSRDRHDLDRARQCALRSAPCAAIERRRHRGGRAC